MRYKVEVTEIVHHQVEYVVEAGSVEEAAEKAEIGDTVEEDSFGLHSDEVYDRIVHGDPEPAGEGEDEEVVG